MVLGDNRKFSNDIKFKKIILTEEPAFYSFFNGEDRSFQNFKNEIYNNPKYKKELDKFEEEKGGNYFSLEDYYDDWLRVYTAIGYFKNKNVLEIGLDNLLKDSVQKTSITDIDEEVR